MTGTEESPVFAFLANPSMVDYAGHLAGVFFVSGCNFRCGFCHNPDLMRQRQAGIPWERLAAACKRFAAEWVDAAVISGGEPTLLPDLPGLLTWFRRYGWALKLDTNGSNPDVLSRCLSLVDYVAMDIKTDPEGYPGLTGFADVDRIRESIRLIREHARDYEFRTTVIEGIHDAERMRGMAELVRGARRYVLQPFVPKPDLPDPALAGKPRTSPDTLRRLQAVAAPAVTELVLRGA